MTNQDKPPTASIDPPPAATKSADYLAAVSLLTDPDTWCRGAEALSSIGDPDGLLELVIAYEARAEGNKMCLLDAMEGLDPIAHSAALMADNDPETRRRGAHLAELFPAPTHLDPLARAAGDADARVRKQALRSLATQKQSAEWEATLVGLLDSSHREARAQAIDSLLRRRTETARAALIRRRALEDDPDLRDRLDRLPAR